MSLLTRSMASSAPPKLQQKKVIIVGAPMAEGQPLGGVEDAPQALRSAGLFKMIDECGWTYDDRGDLDIAPLPGSSRKAETAGKGVIRNEERLGLQSKKIFEAVRAAGQSGGFTLLLGGDHGIAAGSLMGQLAAHPDLAVIWVDAHGDCNTPETSPSGNYHGMPAAHAMGWFKGGSGFDWQDDCPRLKEERLAFIGLRSVDEKEKELLAKSKVTAYSMHHVDRYGIGKVVTDAIKAVDPEGKRPLHLSFDIDACDPDIAFGTGTRCRGGLTYREAHCIVEMLYETGRLVSMDLVEVNPSLDRTTEIPPYHGDRIEMSGGPTVRLAIELIGSALGSSVL